MTLRYTPRAADELEAAVDWYQEQLPGLGLDFLDCVEAALGLLLRNPLPKVGVLIPTMFDVFDVPISESKGRLLWRVFGSTTPGSKRVQF